jgi:hypothetical protein
LNIHTVGWGLLALGFLNGSSLPAATTAHAGNTDHATPDLHAVLSRTIAQVARDREFEEHQGGTPSAGRITETRTAAEH